MTPLENIYTATGELAYAIAKADGTIQREEKEKFQQILEAEFNGKIGSSNHASIIFQILQKENRSAEDAYSSAIRELNTNSHYLSPTMKEHIIHIIERVAQAFPPKVHSENEIIKKFIVDVTNIKVDDTLSKGL
jgi:uncharacterized tellurite resistance protein B-like protein